MQKLGIFLKEKYPFCGILWIPARSSFPKHGLVLFQETGKAHEYGYIHEQKVVGKI